jgi:hypothetical protein
MNAAKVLLHLGSPGAEFAGIEFSRNHDVLGRVDATLAADAPGAFVARAGADGLRRDHDATRAAR